MIGDMLGQIGGMFAALLGPVLPYLLGAAGLVVAAVAVSGLWWARPVREPDPLPAIDPRASDWLGQP